MSDSDQSLTNLRYNQVTQGLEGFGGGSPMWTPLTLVADGGINQLTGDATAGPGAGSQVLTLKTVNLNVGSFTSANITVDAKGRITAASNGAGAGITQLTSDVTAGPGSGSQAATVVSVGGSSAANIHTAELAANAATAINTPSTIVARDGLGNFAASSISAVSIQGIGGLKIYPNVDMTPAFAVTKADAATEVLSVNTDIPSADLHSNPLHNVADPTNPQDAATKAYVDAHSAGTPNVVEGTSSANDATTSSTPSATSLSVTITASSNTATLELLASFSSLVSLNSGGNYALWYAYKDGVAMFGGKAVAAGPEAETNMNNVFSPVSFSFLDIPGDTSPHVYSVWFASSDNTNQVALRGDVARASYIAKEIH